MPVPGSRRSWTSKTYPLNSHDLRGRLRDRRLLRSPNAPGIIPRRGVIFRNLKPPCPTVEWGIIYASRIPQRSSAGVFSMWPRDLLPPPLTSGLPRVSIQKAACPSPGLPTRSPRCPFNPLGGRGGRSPARCPSRSIPPSRAGATKGFEETRPLLAVRWADPVVLEPEPQPTVPRFFGPRTRTCGDNAGSDELHPRSPAGFCTRPGRRDDRVTLHPGQRALHVDLGMGRRREVGLHVGQDGLSTREVEVRPGRPAGTSFARHAAVREQIEDQAIHADPRLRDGGRRESFPSSPSLSAYSRSRISLKALPWTAAGPREEFVGPPCRRRSREDPSRRDFQRLGALPGPRLSRSGVQFFRIYPPSERFRFGNVAHERAKTAALAGEAQDADREPRSETPSRPLRRAASSQALCPGSEPSPLRR